MSALDIGHVGENCRRFVDVADDGVDASVIVEIAKGDAARQVFVLEIGTALRGEDQERTVALVA